MSLVNIISAIGNNSSVYPLLIRDCGIENPIKIGLTYKQNLKDSKQMAKDAFRERAIDEYVCSAIWLGGIPVMDKICNWGIKKLGYDPNIDMNLFKESSKQGLAKNIEKFKNIATEEVKSLEKVLKNKKTYEKLQAGKFVLSTAIPVFLMGYCLPKSNFALTNKLRKKQELQKNEENILKTKQKNSQNISFKGSFVSSLANMSTVNKMAVTDGGLTVGRVATGRNRNERLELGFKMLGMMFLNFVVPAWIAKLFDGISNKLFNTNVNLDPKLLDNKDFLTSIKNNSLKLPKDDIIEFLDNNPNEKFSKLAEEFCGVKRLKNGYRDPRVFIDENKIKSFQKEIEKFAKQAKESGNVDKFAQKALKVKSGNILANITISSILLAICLPKLTFYLRKLITGSDAEPGLVRNA
ncbi:hypothetical protein IJ384_07465 [bacterium]|nr:hypothetical protein [bacterium]